MSLLFGLLATIAGLIAIAYLFSRMKTERATQSLRVILGILGVLLGIVLTLRGLAVVGVPVLTGGLGFLGVALRGTGGTGRVDDRRSNPSTLPAMTRKEAAATLGVSEDATQAEIRTAYRELMKKVHPDAGGSDALAAKVQEARDVLFDD